MKRITIILAFAVLIGCGESADPEVQRLYDLAVTQFEKEAAEKGIEDVVYPDVPVEQVEKNDTFWEAANLDCEITVVGGESAWVKMDLKGKKDGEEKTGSERVNFKKVDGSWVLDE